MAQNINKAFVKHYEAEVHTAYQRMGSKLRNTVRTRNNIRGSRAVFQTIGQGTATTKSRNGTISPMNPDRGSVEVGLQNYYAGDWIDALDELFTSADEKMVAAQAGAYALGRKTDDLIISALNENYFHEATPPEGVRAARITRTTIGTTVERAGLTKEKILEAFEKLGAEDVPDDGQRFAVVGWKQWSELLQIEEFAKADYVGSDELPWRGTQAKHWLGSLWMPHSSLPTSSNVRSCFWYHRTAVGHAVGQDITTDITWHGDRAAHFVSNMMSQGASVIDPKGVIRIRCYEGS